MQSESLKSSNTSKMVAAEAHLRDDSLLDSLQSLFDFALISGIRITCSESGYLYFVDDCRKLLTSVVSSQENTEWPAAFQKSQAVATNDIPGCITVGVPECGATGIQRYLNLPIMDNGKTILIAGVCNKTKDYSAEDVRHLSLLMENLWPLIKQRKTEALSVAYETSEKTSALNKTFTEHQFYERIISSSPDLMALIDRDYIYRMVNDAYSKAFGKTRAEIIGKSVVDLIGPDTFKNFTQKRLDRAFAGESFTYEQWFNLRGIERRFFAVTYHPIHEKEGPIHHIAVDIRDITDLKLAEGDRQRIFDFSLDLLCVAGFDGCFKELNPSWTKTLGWTIGELKSRPFLELIHPADLEATIAAEERLLLRQKITGFENRLKCKDGSYRWISWNSVADIKSKEIFSVARDVTEQKHLAEALKFSEIKYRTLFDSAGDSLFVHDINGKFLDVNHVALKRLGYNREELLQMSLSDIDRSISAGGLNKFLARIKKTGEASFETRHSRKNGTEFTVWINSKLIDYAEESAIFSVARDISERKLMEEKLRILASVDSLTGAYNRRHFMESARKELLRSRRHNTPLPVIMLDIDHFKIINDSYGHDIGDEVLIGVVEKCLMTLRATDIFGRLGGEEFAAVLAQTDAQGARLTAERLRATLEEMIVDTEEGPIRITVSIGLTAAEAGDSSIEEIMKRADMALYEAKAKGRNTVVAVFGDEMNKDLK